ncbi:EAL domain-containing protein [Thiohalobacter sp. IOR34]|uniref:putative bifunctional diguanylate cyclase/phosphodiesterase n=1 Tax=Thiohalobacter sp. IOR34 TaxID=3057176 RepID=UPI0025B01708|nr:EAL domain-containing protein [Thiohalobacter sp. IOR34]WJW74417.1 EAL domain-containing protein [Thiohalobacter sp. IOR34]
MAGRTLIDHWHRLPLHLQLALVSGLLLALTIAGTTLFNIRNQQQALLRQIEDEALSLGRSLAMSSNHLIITNQLDALEQLLVQAAAFPYVQRIQAVDNEGNILSHVYRDGASVHVSYELRKLGLPTGGAEDGKPRLDYSTSQLSLWYPLRTSTPLGWLHIETGLGSLASLRAEIIRDNLQSAGVAIGLDVLSLLLILYAPAREFRRALRFARRLTRQPGEQLPVQGSSRELAELIEALNLSSHRLAEQRSELLARTEEMSRLNESLENRIDRRTRELEERNQQLRLLNLALEQSPTAVLVMDRRFRIIYTNPAFTSITGYTPAEARGRHPAFQLSADNPSHLTDKVTEQLRHGNSWQGEFIGQRRNGERFWVEAILSPVRDEAGKITHYLGIEEDITQRKQYEEQLVKQANFDALTGLPNRLLGMDRLQQALVHGRRQQLKTVLLFLDLDHFKNVNDTLGHSYGDLLLVEAARRIRNCVREEDTVARLGGDEFVVILSDVRDAAATESLAEKICQVLSSPYRLAGRELHISVSIGITVAPDDSTDVNTLLRNADTAMYRAKAAGRNGFQYYTRTMNEEAQARMQIESELHGALERGEFEILYQPILSTATRNIVAAEALLRWNNPQLGQVPPERFIPIAEESGLIIPLGDWVLREACRHAIGWDQPPPFVVAVNLSRVQFRDPAYLQRVRGILQETGLSPAQLHLEITEHTLMEEIGEVTDTINALHNLGIDLCIDDFGTGYSSLSYLRRFPCRTLKIDKSFIHDLREDADHAALVNAIIQMGHSLGMNIIAEGVENEEQLEFLRQQGCEYVQGFLFSSPLSHADLSRLLRDDGRGRIDGAA